MDGQALMEKLEGMASAKQEQARELTMRVDRLNAAASAMWEVMSVVRQHLDHADECRIAQEDAAQQPTPEAFPHLDADGEPGVTDGGVPGG